MPTLTVTTIDRIAGTVTLHVDDRAGVKALVRTDANGTRPVRMPGNLASRLPGIGPGTFTDAEVALGGLVSYKLDHPDFADLVWVDLRGDWAPRFVLPSTPEVFAVAEAVTAYDAAARSTASFHEVIGRPDPLVIEGRLSLRRGRMETEFRTLADASGLLALLKRGKTVLYRQSEQPGMDMYFHTEALDLTADPEAGGWKVTLTYVEVAFPPGTLTSVDGWTFAAVRDGYPSFTALSQSYETFQHLALGDSLA